MKFLHICLALVLVGGQRLAAQAQLDQPGFYRIKLGAFEVTALSDGSINIDLHDLLSNIKKTDIDSLMKLNFETHIEEASVNAYLIKVAGKNILVDAGTAELYGPTLGHLPESLHKIGVEPDQIDAILVTHIHTDHTGGLIIDGKKVFPNATIYISKPEVDFWLNDKNQRKANPRLAKWFKEADDKVGPYLSAGQVKAFEYGTELFPGITPIAAPGHTPGHTLYALESEGQRMLFIGDMVHATAIQFPSPGTTINFDVDEKAAAQQRIQTFKDAAAKGYYIAADHISFPGVGHIRAAGKGFVWIPIYYSTLK